MPVMIIKVTERCNSNCVYCGNINKRDGETISDKTLGTIYQRINKYLTTNPDEDIEILWHGGEPLIPGPSFYIRARELHDLHCPETGGRISYGIQSNLTLLSEEYIEPLRQLSINSIGTSFDPEPHMRGPGQKVNSESYNRRFFRAIELLSTKGFEFGVIYVVTKKSLGEPVAIFHFLTNIFKSGKINLNPVQIEIGENDELAVTQQEYAEFLGAIFPVWWKSRSRYGNIEPFNSLVNRVERSISGDSEGTGSSNGLFIAVGPDGKVTQAGRPSDKGPSVFGHFANNNLEEILDKALNYNSMDVQAKSDNLDCLDCRFWEICRGGSIDDAFSLNDRFLQKSEWCSSRKIFLEKYLEPLTGMTIERRQTA